MISRSSNKEKNKSNTKTRLSRWSIVDCSRSIGASRETTSFYLRQHVPGYTEHVIMTLLNVSAATCSCDMTLVFAHDKSLLIDFRTEICFELSSFLQMIEYRAIPVKI